MDLEQLTHLEALSLPQLVIDGTIVSARGLLSIAEIKAVLQRIEAKTKNLSSNSGRKAFHI